MRQGLSAEMEAIAGIVGPQSRGRQAREAIYKVIANCPGITRLQICGRSGLSYKQIRRHTATLVQAGVICSHKVKRSWRYYDAQFASTASRTGDRGIA